MEHDGLFTYDDEARRLEEIASLSPSAALTFVLVSSFRTLLRALKVSRDMRNEVNTPSN